MRHVVVIVGVVHADGAVPWRALDDVDAWTRGTRLIDVVTVLFVRVVIHDGNLKKMNQIHDGNLKKMNQIHDGNLKKMNQIHDGNLKKMNQIHDGNLK